MRPALKKVSELRPLVEPHRNEFYQALVESIRAKGLMVPIVITEDGVIVKGCRRYRAFQEAEAGEYIPVFVLEGSYTEEELFRIRAELTVLQRSASVKEILTYASGLEVGDRFGADKEENFITEAAIVEEILNVGLGPRLLAALARQIKILVFEPEEEQLLKITGVLPPEITLEEDEEEEDVFEGDGETSANGF